MRLGHPHDQALNTLFSHDKSIFNKSNTDIQPCTHCLFGKMHNLPFPNSQFIASAPFELVHSDLWGPAPINSMNGFRYYILFVDHYSRFTWLYLLKSKTEAFSKFVYFHALIKTQFSATIKCFRLDGGGEFTSNEFKSYLSHHGISCHLSCPYTTQQNGVVERKHRHVVETTVTMLSQASMPSSYWSFAA